MGHVREDNFLEVYRETPQITALELCLTAVVLNDLTAGTHAKSGTFILRQKCDASSLTPSLARRERTAPSMTFL